MIVTMRNSGVVLFVCSGLLLSGGAILGVSAGWSLLRMTYYFWTTEMGTELASGVQLVAGAMLCLPACWLASLVPYHPRAFSLVATLMFLATSALLVLCVGLSSLGALARTVRDPASVNATMYRSLARAQFDPSVMSAFTSMQMELRCCGVQSGSDWLKYRATPPAACCNRLPSAKLDSCTIPLYSNGCLFTTLLELRAYVNSMAVLAAALIIVLGVTLFATAYTMVAGVIERGSSLKTTAPLLAQAPLRVACVHTTPSYYSVVTPAIPAPVPPPTQM